MGLHVAMTCPLRCIKPGAPVPEKRYALKMMFNGQFSKVEDVAAYVSAQLSPASQGRMKGVRVELFTCHEAARRLRA